MNVIEKKKRVRIRNELVRSIPIRSECKEGPDSNKDTNNGGTNTSHTEGTVVTTVERTGRNGSGR